MVAADGYCSHPLLYLPANTVILLSVNSWRYVLWPPFNPSAVSLLTLGEKILVIYL